MRLAADFVRSNADLPRDEISARLGGPGPCSWTVFAQSLMRMQVDDSWRKQMWEMRPYPPAEQNSVAGSSERAPSLQRRAPSS